MSRAKSATKTAFMVEASMISTKIITSAFLNVIFFASHKSAFLKVNGIQYRASTRDLSPSIVRDLSFGP